MDKEEKKGGESLLVPEHEQEDRESADVGFLAEQITNEAEQQIETLAQEGDVLAEKIATKFGEEVDEETRSSLQSLVEQAKKIGARLKEAIFSIIPERKVDEYALENKLTYYFNSAKIDKIKKIVDSGVLPAENIQALGRSGLGDLLRNGKFNRAKKILDSGILSDEIIRETAENAFDLLFQLDKISTIKEIADSGVLPTEFVQQALKNILSFAIRYREPMEKIKEIIDLGVLLPEIIQQVGKDCLARVVMGRSSKRIKDYIEIMGLSVEISPSELQQFGEMSMLASLRLGLTDEIKEIINFFQLSEETAKELIEKNLSEIPVSVIVKINEVFDFAKFDEAKIAWSEPLKKLLKVQDMASRREHCPWKKEIDPLVSQSVTKGFISLDRR
ncbi:MAG TPA: hypothetical protein PK367_03260, partial [Candidatus Paceibacterota bacterium]|nr:hypothetical protein [Candidatus Paceibacterota bacterium]